MKCRAAVLVEQKKPLVIEEIEMPKLGYGQVLVKVICSGICGSQIGEIDGVKGPDRFLPHLLGHEGGGEVIECGDGVKNVKAGDRVVMHWRKGAGLECVPPKYQSKLGLVNAGWITTFNEYAVTAENRITRVSDSLPPEVAALMGCAVTTGFGVVNNNAQVKIGESVVIYGAGGVGLSIIQAAAMSSAYPIVAVDLHDNRLELARKVGATHLINAAKTGAGSNIRQIVGNGGVDVFIDNTGNVKVIQLGYELTSSCGRLVLVGVPKKDANISINTLPLHFGKSIIGSHGGESLPAKDIPRYERLYQSGRLSLKEIVGRRYGLDSINQAISDMRSGAVAGRCLIML